MKWLAKYAPLRYLGRVEITSDEFRYMRQRYSEERKWYYGYAGAEEAARSRHLFFTYPRKSLLIEIHLEETYDYNRFRIEREETPPPWSRYWHIVLRGIVPWEVVEASEQSPLEKRPLNASCRGCSWDKINPQPTLKGRAPLEEGNLQVVTVDCELSHASSSNDRGGSWRTNWTEETLPSSLTLAVMSHLLKTGLVEHVVPAPIPHLTYMLPEPRARFQYEGCIEHFWRQYPIEPLMKYCDERVCRTEYEAWVAGETSERYRSFLTPWFNN